MTEEKKAWLRDYLQERNLIASTPTFEEVSGGIVNNIYRVKEDGKSFIIKEYSQTPKFDPSLTLPGGRYRVEKTAYGLMGKIFPDHSTTPKVFLADDKEGILILEDLETKNRFDYRVNDLKPEMFDTIGKTLAKIANQTAGKQELMISFNNTEFQKLKDDIRYYHFIKNPKLFSVRDQLMERAHKHRVSFLHDDIRFNNIFLKDNSFVFIDFEGAYYGDSALDIAHLLAELFLYRFALGEERFKLMILNLWDSFLSALRIDEDLKELESVIVKHIGFGLLDRVQGAIKDDYPFVKDRARMMDIGEGIILSKQFHKIPDLLTYEC